MTNKKISQLTQANLPLVGTEELPIVQNGSTVKASIEDVKGYKTYVAILTQSDENDPVATVIQNTIGNIVWSRTGVGDFIGNLSNGFPANKTTINSEIDQFLTTMADTSYTGWIDENTVGIQTFLSSSIVDGFVAYVWINVYRTTTTL